MARERTNVYRSAGKRRLTLCIRLGEFDQGWGQDLGHASDACRHDKEAGAGRFEDPDSERFRQRRVQEYLSPRENLIESGAIVSTLHLDFYTASS